ncbi:hypothetical protein EW146_g8141, partial [Bondarzewia mesenterica]
MSSTTVEPFSVTGDSNLNTLPKWKAPPPTTETELEWADILTVDLSLYDTQRSELVKTVETALQRDGFFYVVGHGIAKETLEHQFSIGQLAFDGVSREEKEQHRAPIAEEGSFIGYKLQNYWEISNGIKDRIEHYNFYLNHIDPVSRHPKPLQPYVNDVKAYIAETRQKVLRRVLTLIDVVLGLEEGHLWNLHEDAQGRTGDDLFRYMIYDPLTSDEASKTNNVMLSGHTDFNSISTLVSQPITALQILMPDGHWRYHQDGALVINIGDQLSFMSGGLLKGTIHRVVLPPKDQLQYRRLGVFHFAHFINGIPLDLLPSKKVQTEGRKIFDERIPTTDEWEHARVKTYGTAKLIKGEKYDVEYIADSERALIVLRSYPCLSLQYFRSSSVLSGKFDPDPHFEFGIIPDVRDRYYHHHQASRRGHCTWHSLPTPPLRTSFLQRRTKEPDLISAFRINVGAWSGQSTAPSGQYGSLKALLDAVAGANAGQLTRGTKYGTFERPVAHRAPYAGFLAWATAMYAYLTVRTDRTSIQSTFRSHLRGVLETIAAPDNFDPCAKIAGLTFAAAADAIACQKSFPFNETLRQNVLNNIARVFDFFTFEDFYLNSPPPFQESTTNIRADIARINSTRYTTDYDFNLDVWDFTTQLNDGHTRWFPNCYNTYQNILPAPVVTLEVNGTQNVFIAPDSVEFLTLLGSGFTSFFNEPNELGFDWQRLAGAKVLEIGGMDAYDYVDKIASTVSGNYLDHGVRVNSVFSSYRISGTGFSQRVGDLAGPSFLTQTSLTFKLIPVDSNEAETVTVPYVASFLGIAFTDQDSFWANNCAATDATNGVDLRASATIKDDKRAPRQARAAIVDVTSKQDIALPDPFLPTLSPVNGSTGVIKSFILPDNKTGVMFVGSFEGDFVQFQTDTLAAISQFQSSNVTRLLIDLTNNGGGFVCLGFFLHQFLAGLEFGYPGFQSTSRANPLAQKILKADIAQGLTDALTFYSPDNWAFLNDTEMPLTFDYNDPAVLLTTNGRLDPTSQRFHDICTPYSVPVPQTPPFDLKNVAIVSNGNCASTCAMFSTLMNERHNTSIAVFGGKPGEDVQFKGMAGNQVLEWTDLDTEIKTAGVKDVAPPDLLVSANMRHNWRTAWSFLNESKPIAYVSELPKFRFPYTTETYNNPQKLWEFALSAMSKASSGKIIIKPLRRPEAAAPVAGPSTLRSKDVRSPSKVVEGTPTEEGEATDVGTPAVSSRGDDGEEKVEDGSSATSEAKEVVGDVDVDMEAIESVPMP